jgi:hypothetical protein
MGRHESEGTALAEIAVSREFVSGRRKRGEVWGKIECTRLAWKQTMAEADIPAVIAVSISLIAL